VADESLYLAFEREIYVEKFKKKVKYTGFSALQATWKTKNKLAPQTSKGDIISYLEKNEGYTKSNDLESNSEENHQKNASNKPKKTVVENVSQMKIAFQ